MEASTNADKCTAIHGVLPKKHKKQQVNFAVCNGMAFVCRRFAADFLCTITIKGFQAVI